MLGLYFLLCHDVKIVQMHVLLVFTHDPNLCVLRHECARRYKNGVKIYAAFVGHAVPDLFVSSHEICANAYASRMP